VVFAKETQKPTDRAFSGQKGKNLSKTINKIMLGYDPKYGIDNHESVLSKSQSGFTDTSIAQ
jgi:hypothetical protein